MVLDCLFRDIQVGSNDLVRLPCTDMLEYFHLPGGEVVLFAIGIKRLFFA
jgi:hypothetical protein